jgi:hypothetical protein
MTDFIPAGTVAEFAAAVKQEFRTASDVSIDRVANGGLTRDNRFVGPGNFVKEGRRDRRPLGLPPFG